MQDGTHHFADYKLGESAAEVLGIKTRRENIDATLALATQCQRTIAIASRDLDPFVYDRSDLFDALKILMLSNHRASIRILVFEPELIIRRGHRLIDLARRMSSYMEMRKSAAEYRFFNEAWFIADETAYICRESALRYEGRINFNDRREAQVLLEAFNNMWNAANPDPNLRGMHI